MTHPVSDSAPATASQPASANISPVSEAASTHSSPWQRGGVWLAWVVYVGYLLLSDLPPGPSLLHTSPDTLREAGALSLNFWFVLPALFPAQAPTLHPALEGLFNVVVTWGLLFWGFAIEGRQQRVPMLPFLIGTAFLTNVFYLPWLGLRQSRRDRPTRPLNRLETITESRAYPIALMIILLAAIAWGLWGRADFGSISDRWTDLVQIVQSDRLAYSFWIDLLVFWLFQGWLVPDDMARRQWQDPVALWSARLIPAFGLVIYFLRRPPIT
ncbi:hypothetical protein [Leptolyngbya iicbica]|uniref:DUF2834 domain-containing protein n=2 Tax=Cyanophyceae TaxID=3028117 RepID=A0A4V2E3M0_9CYAN|nr:hypothetical protein [Leptolyngbya sp. LK]RZM82910.1 hypothetical protein DYY88_06855 [Leptolyngbya sp. LK]